MLVVLHRCCARRGVAHPVYPVLRTKPGRLASNPAHCASSARIWYRSCAFLVRQRAFLHKLACSEASRGWFLRCCPILLPTCAVGYAAGIDEVELQTLPPQPTLAAAVANSGVRMMADGVLAVATPLQKPASDYDKKWPIYAHPCAFPYGRGECPKGMSFEHWARCIILRHPIQQFAQNLGLIVDLLNITHCCMCLAPAQAASQAPCWCACTSRHAPVLKVVDKVHKALAVDPHYKAEMAHGC